MIKLRVFPIAVIVFALLESSCIQENDVNKLDNEVNKTDNYEIGDCFLFKDVIKEFGVVLLEDRNYPDGRQFNLFPVKLDTTKIGINQFKYGNVYLNSFSDLTKPSGVTYGFSVYNFLHQKDFEIINKYFVYIGDIKIKKEYQNTTGGTIASSYDDFRYQLKHWDKMFGIGGQVKTVKEIMP